MSIQLQIYLERSGIINEATKSQKEKIEDFVKSLEAEDEKNQDNEEKEYFEKKGSGQLGQIRRSNPLTPYEQIAENVLTKMGQDKKLQLVKNTPATRISREFKLTIDPRKKVVECMGDYLQCISDNHEKIHKILDAETTKKSEKKYTNANLNRSIAQAVAEAVAEVQSKRETNKAELQSRIRELEARKNRSGDVNNAGNGENNRDSFNDYLIEHNQKYY